MSVPPVLTILLSDLDNDILGIVCCAGYERGRWRTSRLAKHLLDWLPDCALTRDEKAAAEPLKPYRTLEMAARRFFKPDSDGPRGELGELLVHAVCAQEFKTRQFVARLFYKMRTNDQVTGFDIVHLRFDQASDKLELWLGEAKFHTTFSSALSKSITSISDHLDAGFLTETKALIGPKISQSDPLFSKLSWIFDNNVSLDEIVDRMVVPVLIAADCSVDAAIGSLPKMYATENKRRLEQMQQRFMKKHRKELTIVAIYLPLNDKAALEKEFHNRLGALT